MRIGVVSDVHSKPGPLRAALAAMDGLVDEVWCAGDVVLESHFCGETIGLLREARATAVLGNHDAVLLSPAGARARRGIDPADPDLAWLASLPRRHQCDVDGRRLLLVHANPWEPWDDYLWAHDRRWRDADELGVDIVVTGHTHHPMVERFGATLVVNPGSVSEPRQRADRRGTCAVIDTVSGSAEILGLPAWPRAAG